MVSSISAPTITTQTKSYDINDVISGLNHDQFVGFYQPKVCSKTEKVIGVEVLARWLHPEDGLISPFHFINLLEQHEKIQLLSKKLLEQAVTLRKNNLSIFSGMQFCINLSMLELDNINLPEELEAICSRFSMPTQQVALELTESTLNNNIKQSLDVLLRLKLKGFKLSIDDFGTGYSSIKQLNDLPFDELKIDRCFVDGCAIDHNKKVIVSTTCEMANKLGLEIVAEGVEDIDDLLVVKNYGVTSIQGFYYFKPCLAEELVDIVTHDVAKKCSNR